MPIPETQQENTDLIALLTTSFQEIEEFEEAGEMKKQLVLNPETAYWQLHKVNSNSFAKFVFELKELERRATDCFHNMSSERAVEMAKQLKDFGKSYRHSIDAKSSESVRDKNNNERTLIDILKSNKIERAYVVRDEVKKGMMSGFLGRDQERDQQRD